jgi:hypothetical protein
VRLTKPHGAPDREPLVLRRGDAVRRQPRSDPEALAAVEEWPAFVWVLSGARGGWVPGRFLTFSPDGTGKAVRDYDTTELSADPGEVLEVLVDDAESGWLWGRAPDGREGWLPWNAVKPLAPRRSS